MLVIGDDLVIDYPIIDADAHVNEPPNLWLDRMPNRLKDRAPRVMRQETGGDVWSFENGARLFPVGRTAAAGLSYVQFRGSNIKYEEIRAGSFDPQARIGELDLDGIYGQLLYPSITLGGARIYSDDAEMQIACVRAYNDWLADFCEYRPDRLYGLAVMPTVGVDAAVTEFERALQRGMRGAILSRYPNGSYDPIGDDDRFWAMCVEADVPAHVHIGGFFERTRILPPGGKRHMGYVGSNKAGGDVFPVVNDLIFSGIFDKFPTLKVVIVESNIGWIPTLLEQTDDMFLRYRFGNEGLDMKLMPSEYFYRNLWTTFMRDTHGVANRYKCGINHIMWSTDYPHTGSDWPNSRTTLELNFRGVPYADVKKMIHDNAVSLYKLNVPA